MATETVRNLPAQFIEDIGKDLATQITAQTAIPVVAGGPGGCLLYTSPSPRDRQKSRMPSSA